MTTYQRFLALFFLAALVWSGISPESRSVWLLESIPVLLAAIVTFLVSKRYPLSSLSYTLLVIYFVAALMPAHYSVAEVPFGFTLGEWFGVERNMYDRMLHFFLGFLAFMPMREWAIQLIKDKGFLSYFLPFGAVFAFSAIYEILEWVAHVSVRSAASISFVGAQGDLWDASKDMAMAGVGALVTILVLVVVNRMKRERS